MEESLKKLLSAQVNETYITQGMDSLRTSNTNALSQLLTHKKLPSAPWTSLQIKLVLNQLAMMDSNNFQENVGLGEREARIAAPLVYERHHGLCHGIGRSGELTSVQPKAAGSSVLMKLTNNLLLDSLRLAGLQNHAATTCFVVPMATGMALTLVFLTLRATRPSSAKFILWPRIDQKSCFKAILTAGFTPVIVPNVLEGDELRTDVGFIEKFIEENGVESILCIYSTTSCFAPRVPDRLVELAQLAAKHQLPHVVNNAYGVQSAKCLHLISEAARTGRIDAFVQSTDKNYLVPVGGAVIAGPDSKFIDSISKMYPGRASNQSTLDLFITFLTLGAPGFKKLLQDRKENFAYLKEKLGTLAQTHGTRLLATPHNDISMGISLGPLTSPDHPDDVTFLGSMLFSRCVSGSRVVPTHKSETISGYVFKGFMAHADSYPAPYLTVAAALGVTREEIDTFITRTNKVMVEFKKKKLVHPKAIPAEVASVEYPREQSDEEDDDE